MATISSVTPIVNTASAALSSNITLVFDSAVDTTTINLDNIKVQGSISGLFSGTFSFTNNNKTVVFDPSQNFQPGEEIQVTVTSGVQDATGAEASKYVYAFRAGVNFFSSGVFTQKQEVIYEAGQTTVSANTFSNSDTVLGDFDGDGDLDAFLGNGGSQPTTYDPTNRVWLNDGTGLFSPKADGIVVDSTLASYIGSSGIQSILALTTSEVFGGDFDGDGDIDIFTASFGVEGVYINNGGQFTLTQVLTGPIVPNKFSGLLQGDVSSGVDLGDIDGDGDIDAAVSNFGETQIYFNDGTGKFTNSGQSLLPVSHAAGIDLGDLDGDGDLDLALGSFPSTQYPDDFFIGLEAVADFVNGGVAQTPRSGAASDLNVDTLGYNTTWRNDGNGNFTLWQQLEANIRSAVLKLGDVDGDGDLDALSANLGPGNLSGDNPAPPYGFAATYSGRDLSAGNQLWINDGQGNFTAGQLIGTNITNGVEFGDFDGDGDLDIWEANFGKADGVTETEDRIWINDGSGNFTDSGQALVTGVSANVAFGDLNGDGALDAFVSNFAYDQPSRVYLNSIEVAISSVTPVVNTASAALDSNITLVFDAAVNPTTVNSATIKVQGSISGLIGGSFSFTNNNKTVVFDPNQNFQPGEEVQVTVTNGVTDAVGGSVSKYVYTFRAGVNYFSSGILTDSNQALDPGVTSDDPVLGDFDGDGDLDVFVANAVGAGGDATNKVFLNDGAGQFSLGLPILLSPAIESFVTSLRVPGTDTPVYSSGADFLAGNNTSEAFAGDFDGDGDLDIFASNFGADGVYLNDGQGRFTLTQLLAGFQFPAPSLSAVAGGDISSGVDLGDIDGDGDIDAVTSNFGSAQVYLNDGTGNFVKTNQNSLGNAYSAGIDLGDLDGDGDLDMAIGNFPSFREPSDYFIGVPNTGTGLEAIEPTTGPTPGYNTIWFNDGNGTFTDSGQQLEAGISTAAMKLGDLDGDGDLDAVSANLGPGELGNPATRNTPIGNQIWINNGSGFFSAGQLVGNEISNGVEVADFDGDGDLDIFAVNFGADDKITNTENRLWLNDGSANFTDSGQLLGNNVSANAAIGDLNGDGALDVFVANYYQQANRVYLNSIDSSKPEASLNTATNVVAVSKSTNLKFKLTQVNTTAVKEVGFFVVRDNNGTITDEDGNSLTPADAGYTAAAIQQATVLFAALGNNPAGFDPLSFDRIVGALGGSVDVFAGGAKLVFYFVQEGSTDSLAAGNGGSVLFGTTFESNAFGASANLTITSLGNGKFSLSWLDNLTLTLESTDDPLPFGSGFQGQNQLEILDLTGLTEDIQVKVTVYREAAFDNLVGFYVINDTDGTVAGTPVGSSDYVAKALANRITTLDLLKVGNGASETFNGVLGKGQYLAPFIIVNGTLDEALAGNADVYFPFLGSNSDGGADHVRLLANNVFGFEDLAGGGDNDFQDLIVQIKAA